MRWKPVETLPDWVAWPLLAIFSPAIALAFLFFGVVWLKRQVVGPTEAWGPWFAWYPIRRNVNNEYDESVWLEWVERQSDGPMCDTFYRARYEETP